MYKDAGIRFTPTEYVKISVVEFGETLSRLTITAIVNGVTQTGNVTARKSNGA